MIYKILLIAFLLPACSESGFTGSGAAREPRNSKEPSSDDGNPDKDKTNTDKDDPKVRSDKDDRKDDLGEEENDSDASIDFDDSEDESKPDGFIDIENGERVINADYSTCATLPAAGKQGYGKCPDNSVVVIVNDGKAAEMTCCPLGGKNILSTKDAEKHQLRTGVCQANEVLTGMQSSTAGTGFCTKINEKYLKLSSPVPSQYVNGNAPGLIGQIAKSYNVNDTCICPEGTIAIGGHTSADNRCGEQCVKIEEK